MPSIMPLVILERNLRRMPSPCFLMVFAASMTGWGPQRAAHEHHLSS